MSSLESDRVLQVATLGNENVKGDGYEDSYWVIYGILGLFAIGSVWLAMRYGYYFICKYGFGREDPVDQKEFMAGLSDEQRQAVVATIVNSSLVKDPDEDSGNRVTRNFSFRRHGDVESQSAKVNSERSSSARSLTKAVSKTAEASAAKLDKDNCPVKDDSDSSIGLMPTKTDGVLTQDEDSDSENRNVCPICLGDYQGEDRVFLAKRCQHQFHGSCILEWLNTKQQNDCPVCRAEVISEDEMFPVALIMFKDHGRK